MMPAESLGFDVLVFFIFNGSKIDSVIALVYDLPVTLSRTSPRRLKATFEYVERSLGSNTLNRFRAFVTIASNN